MPRLNTPDSLRAPSELAAPPALDSRPALPTAEARIVRDLLIEGRPEAEIATAVGLTVSQLRVAVHDDASLQGAKVSGLHSRRRSLQEAAMSHGEQALGVLVEIMNTPTEWDVETTERGSRVLVTGPKPSERIAAAKVVLDLTGTGSPSQQRADDAAIGVQQDAPTAMVHELAAVLAAARAQGEEDAERRARVDVTPERVIDVEPG